ncbi:hypothetical protein QQX98_000514 [Neonectria punicea]|uniref:Uncharacterized protein n=1 Tax=Neonectria punicea TaxID=979145 RepID=A0ABR1HUG2_9HYPO
MKPGKRPREEKENEIPPKRLQSSYHDLYQVPDTPLDSSSEQSDDGLADDLDDSDEPMEEAPLHYEVVCYGADKSCYYLANPVDGINHNFAELDRITTSYLVHLEKFEGISFSAILPSAGLDKISGKKTKKSTIIDVTINILGPDTLAERVGEALADGSAYLQHPAFLDADIKYLNPHYFYPDDVMTDLRHLIGPRQEDARSKQICQGIETVLQSLGGASSPNSSEEYDVETLAKSFLANTRLKRYARFAVLEFSANLLL